MVNSFFYVCRLRVAEKKTGHFNDNTHGATTKLENYHYLVDFLRCAFGKICSVIFV